MAALAPRLQNRLDVFVESNLLRGSGKQNGTRRKHQWLVRSIRILRNGNFPSVPNWSYCTAGRGALACALMKQAKPCTA